MCTSDTSLEDEFLCEARCWCCNSGFASGFTSRGLHEKERRSREISDLTAGGL